MASLTPLRVTCASAEGCGGIYDVSAPVVLLIALATFLVLFRMHLGPIFYWYKRDEEA